MPRFVTNTPEQVGFPESIKPRRKIIDPAALVAETGICSLLCW